MLRMVSYSHRAMRTSYALIPRTLDVLTTAFPIFVAVNSSFVVAER
jgi:hypothetical protein